VCAPAAAARTCLPLIFTRAQSAPLYSNLKASFNTIAGGRTISWVLRMLATNPSFRDVDSALDQVARRRK
jgi:hypothetical protein